MSAPAGLAASEFAGAIRVVRELEAATKRHLVVLHVAVRAGSAWDILDCPWLDVPDLTRGLTRWPYTCPGRSPNGRVCTRRAPHTGRHAAGDGTHVTAVWGTGAGTASAVALAAALGVVSRG